MYLAINIEHNMPGHKKEYCDMVVTTLLCGCDMVVRIVGWVVLFTLEFYTVLNERMKGANTIATHITRRVALHRATLQTHTCVDHSSQYAIQYCF